MKRDFSETAFDMVAMLTGQKPKVAPPQKRKADPEKMRALGSKGGAKGGRARADKLNGEARKAIAQKAAAARWSKD